MENCTKCGLEIMLNEGNGLWETEDAIFCIQGPSPFKHIPPWSKPEPLVTDREPVYMAGYGFIC